MGSAKESFCSKQQMGLAVWTSTVPDYQSHGPIDIGMQHAESMYTHAVNRSLHVTAKSS